MNRKYVDYKIYRDINSRDKASLISEHKEAACFAMARLAYKDMNTDSGIHYMAHKNEEINDEIVRWWHKKTLEMGLPSRLFIGRKYYNFYVKYQIGNFYRMLTILTALRYVEESALPKLIKWTFENSTKHKNIPWFYIFQLSHYAKLGSWNYGHSFLFAPSFYYSNIGNLISLEEFKESYKTCQTVSQCFEKSKHVLKQSHEVTFLQEALVVGNLKSAIETLTAKTKKEKDNIPILDL